MELLTVLLLSCLVILPNQAVSGCDIVSISGSRYQKKKEGTFILTNETCGSRGVYKQKGPLSANYLFYLDDLSHWIIGFNLCANNGGMFVKDQAALTPDKVTQHWKEYKSDSWRSNSNMKNECDDCSGSFYGENCQKSCGMCEGGCHSYYGTCKGGCKAGWSGNMCTRRQTYEALEKQLGVVSRQLMLQQLFVEERIRSDGNSGLKQVRLNTGGTRPYHAASHSASGRVASLHDHANYNNTVGLGELIVVMNGVEFRTRHNDYKLKMAHTSSSDYEATEDIPFPDVPTEVTDKGTLEEQIEEMREWFKAWRDQDHSVRDYRPHFKANLCYMEGAWTTSVDDIQESFDSDRHSLDASSWLDLQDKIRFTSYSGAKSQLENFAYLPTTIMNMINGTIPQLAQWNYRILCHPIKRDLPLNRFRVVDEIATRMRNKLTYEQLGSKRDARFQLNPKDGDTFEEGIHNFGLLDELMYEIPGKNNGKGKLQDDLRSSGDFTYDSNPSEDLNAARYHRWFRTGTKDAMGTARRHRGFSDENLFAALTTQPQVAGMEMEQCKRKDCRTVKQRWSYAIPLEIIYLTPLSKWNPHNIEYKGHSITDLAKTVTANNRNGGTTPETAFDGVNNRYYYITPSEFFNSSSEVGKDAADTTRSGVGVLDKKGNMHLMSAAGIRANFPNIPEVGFLRQRYPIMPVHGEGSSVWKELEALKDLVLRPITHGYLFREQPGTGTVGASEADDSQASITLRTGPSNADTGRHIHHIDLLASEMAALQSGQLIGPYTTTLVNGHSHTMLLKYTPPKDSVEGFFSYTQCDDKPPGNVCLDGHQASLIAVTI